MAVYRTFLLLVFACSVLSEEGQLFEACNTSDFKCLKTTIEAFFEKTYNGMPENDVKPMDPLVIPKLELVLDEGLGLVLDFKNLNVTGLKNPEVSYYQIDTVKKSAEFRMKSDLNIVGDLTVRFTKQGKALSGQYTAATTTFGSFQYGYSFMTKGGQEYFVVGPATSTCEIIGANVFVDSNLVNTWNNDPDAKEMQPTLEKNKVTLRNKTLCKIVETAYITVIHNIRAASTTFPKSVFFKDI